MPAASYADRKKMVLDAISEQFDADEDLMEDIEEAIRNRDYDFIESLIEMAFEALGWVFESIGSFVSDVFSSLKKAFR